VPTLLDWVDAGNDKEQALGAQPLKMDDFTAAATAVAAPAPRNCTPSTFGAVRMVSETLPCNETVDSTPAFELALHWCNVRQVVADAGLFRIDGTIYLKHGLLELPISTALVRTNCSASTGPIVIVGQEGHLIGRGSLKTANPSPRGAVVIGPDCTGYTNGTLYHNCMENVEFASVEGVSISGHAKHTNFDLNPKWSPNSTDPAVAMHQCGGFLNQQASFGVNGSVGLCMDSSQPNMVGSTYLNTVRGVSIASVDVGLYLGAIVNANQFHNLIFYKTTVATWVESNNENSFVGGFSHFGEAAPGQEQVVIRGTHSGYNLWTGVQGEPGGNSRYLQMSGSQNQVVGHNNCGQESYINDKSFAGMMNGGMSANSMSAHKLESATGIIQHWPANTSSSHWNETAREIEKAATHDTVEMEFAPVILNETDSDGSVLSIGRLDFYTAEPSEAYYEVSLTGSSILNSSAGKVTSTSHRWQGIVQLQRCSHGITVESGCSEADIKRGVGLFILLDTAQGCHQGAVNTSADTLGLGTYLLIPLAVDDGQVIFRRLIVSIKLVGRFLRGHHSSPSGTRPFRFQRA
jgi:hypothetical protein